MRRAVALAALVLSAAGCPSRECTRNADCDLGLDCTDDGRCVTSSLGKVTWVSPKDGSQVDAFYDAVVEVSFKGVSATLHIDRSARGGGDPCEPFTPKDIVIQGNAAAVQVQQITIPGLRALGADFKMTATFGAATENADTLELLGPAGDVGGITVSLPSTQTADASLDMTVPVEASFSKVANHVELWTEPEGGVITPKVLLAGGAGINTTTPLVRGTQIVWIESFDSDGNTHLCGTGLFGAPGPDEVTDGLELGLFFEGAEPGQLDLHLRVNGTDACNYEEPGARCTVVSQSRMPSKTGQEVLKVNAVDGDLVEVVVVAGAAGAPLSASVRVSQNGNHAGFFGPMLVNPGLGESWVAGTVTIAGTQAKLAETDEIVAGPPF